MRQLSAPVPRRPHRLRLRPAELLPLAALAALLAGPAVEAQVVTVDENNAGWLIGGESGAPVFGFVVGPAPTPLGSGSVHFQLPAPGDGAAVGSGVHNGTRLAAVTTLTYSTYQNMSPQAISLQFNVDYDDTDGTTVWQGRLVFEPLTTGGPVMINTWQSWNALSGTWWSTGVPVVGDGAQPVACPQSAPCSWATILATYPNAAIHSTLGALLLKAGSGWPAGWDGNADALRIATAGFDFTYDFETIVPVELQSFSID